jgi:hypothetical protein
VADKEFLIRSVDVVHRVNMGDDAIAATAAAAAEAAAAEAVASLATIDAAVAFTTLGLVSALQNRSGFFRTPPAWDVGMAVPVRIGCVDGVVAAFAKRDAAFKTGWRDGNLKRHIDSATGELWESVSLAKMKDPQANGIALTEAYHHHTTGSNANPGTALSPKKGFNAALAVGTDVHVRPLARMIGSVTMNPRAWSKNAQVKITGSHPSGGFTYVADMRDNQGWTFTSLGDGVFKTNQFVSINPKNTPILCNVRTRDAKGHPIFYSYVSTTYADDAARKAALLAAAGAGEGAWLLDLTAGANTEGWYIKTADGLAPDLGPEASHIYSEATNLAKWEPYAGKVIYCENLAFIYNAKTADQPGQYFSTQGLVINQNQEWTGEVGLYNVAFYAAGKQGLRLDDVKRANVDRFVAIANHEDSMNPHSWNTPLGVSPLMGSYMKMTFSNGVLDGVGNFGFRDQATLSRSGNAFTVHDRIGMTGFNLVGGNTFGAVCACVGASKTWLINCHFHTPTNPDGEGPITGSPGNAGSPAAPYWADGAGTELWLSYCSGNGGFETLVATNGGKIYVDNFIGSWTGRVMGGGQILDFDGNVLLS